MTTTLPPKTTSAETLADFVERLGGVPLQRIRMKPPPGTATERDVVDLEAREDRLCELVDGVLVEKGMGYNESALAMFLVEVLRAYVRSRKLGRVTGEAG